MGTKTLSWILGASILSAVGCAAEAPLPKVRKAPEDPWDRISTGPEWLHATQGVSGSHAVECKHVLEWVKNERRCTGALCVHGHALSREWLARCKTLVPAGVAEVEDASAEMSASKDEPLSKCASEHAKIVRDGCGDGDRTCELAAQRWATRCGKSEGTPLVVRMLERSVERRRNEPGRFELDTRSCDDLLADVALAARCAQRFDCEDALKKVYLRRGRCEAEGERASATTAMLETVILHGAEQPTPPVPIQQAATKIDATPSLVPLADSTGVLIAVCDARVLDPSKVLAQRRACQNGKVVVARLIAVTPRETELRLVTLEFPDDRTVHRRFPWLAIAGESAARDVEAVATIAADVDKLVKLPKAEAARELLRVVHANAALLRRSAGARAPLSAHDGSLGAALAEIGKMKMASVRKARLSPVEMAGLAARARTRAFADVGPEGALAPLLDLEVSPWLPKATAAYATEIAPLQRAARRPDARALEEASMLLAAAAAACGRAQQEVVKLDAQAVRCAFGTQPCTPAQLQAAHDAVDAARTKADSARASMLIARSMLVAGGQPDPVTLEADSGCTVPPWW